MGEPRTLGYTITSSLPAFMAAASSFEKTGVPKPVAGSHPFAQAKPYLTGPVPRPIAFVPTVTSVKASLFW